MRDKMLNASLLVLSICALAMTGLLIKREFAPKRNDATSLVEDARWQGFAKGGISTGPLTAPETVIVFSDFQCPFCKALSPNLAKLENKYPGLVRVVFHHYPLEEIHPYAREAALAAECANSQGKFAEMEQALFSNQAKLGISGWGWFGQQAGIADSAWMNSCVATKKFSERLESDLEMGRTVPVDGTPLVFVNSLRFPAGAPNFFALDSLVSADLKKKGLRG